MNKQKLWRNLGVCTIMLIALKLSGQPKGLENLGLSCYQNAALQCLYNVHELSKIIIEQEPDYYKADSLAQKYVELVNLLRKSAGPSLAPVAFCERTWQQRGFPERAMADAGYFLKLLLEDLYIGDVNEMYQEKMERYGYPIHNQLKNKIGDLFKVLQGVSLVCKKCDYLEVYRVSAPLVIPLNKDNPMQHQLNDMFSMEEEEGYCTECGSDETTLQRTTFILHIPDILILEKLAPQEGILPVFSFPFNKLSLTLSNGTRAHYELIGLVLHRGVHYTALVKSKNNNWYFCDDKDVYPYLETGVKNAAIAGKTDTGFIPRIFFYRKTDGDNLPEGTLQSAELRGQLKKYGITPVLLKEFLDNLSAEKNYPFHEQNVIEGINQHLITVDLLAEQIWQQFPDKVRKPESARRIQPTDFLQQQLQKLQIELAQLYAKL